MNRLSELLNLWDGAIEINGTSYINKSAIPSDLVATSNMIIILKPIKDTSEIEEANSSDTGVFRVEVRQYMLKKSTPEFDFMAKWNKDEPMPYRVMYGSITGETRGMYKMNLHADLLQDRVQVCMKCGRVLDNPISQYFGLGPECGNHNYVNPFSSEAELKEAVNSFKKELREKKWEGWIPKSAIIKLEEVS